MGFVAVSSAEYMVQVRKSNAGRLGHCFYAFPEAYTRAIFIVPGASDDGEPERKISCEVDEQR